MEGWGECGDSQAGFTDESKEREAMSEGKQRAEIRAEVLRQECPIQCGRRRMGRWEDPGGEVRKSQREDLGSVDGCRCC